VTPSEVREVNRRLDALIARMEALVERLRRERELTREALGWWLT
jgi:hypothetical protein